MNDRASHPSDPAVDPWANPDGVRAAFDSGIEGIVVVALDGRLLAYNAQFQALWQFPAAMVARRDVAEMRAHTAVQMRDPDAYLRSAPRLGAGAIAGLYDELALRDGRVFERHVTPVQQPCPAVVVRWRDVSVQRHTEQALALSRERKQAQAALLDLAMMDASVVFWDADLQTGRMSSTNGHWHSMLGYTPDEVPDTVDAWDGLVHPDDGPARQAAWEAHLQGLSSTFETEFRIRHKEGHWVWFAARGRVVRRAADGQPLQVVGMRMDITERKLTEVLLEGLAHTDALTGVSNRRRFEALAGDEMARAVRHGQPLALLMLDLDHFKAINDVHGHAGGDAVLRAFADIARGLMRQGDVLARVGGEEFAVLLPQTTLEGAETLANRLRLQVQAQAVPLPGGQAQVTVSIGVAAWLPGAAAPVTLDELVAAADRALYRGKAAGRNRVVVAQPGV